MLRADKIREKISSIWGETDAAQICFLILDHIVKDSKQSSTMITFSDIARWSSISTNDSRIIKAVSILGGALDVLEWRFVYFPENDEAYYLDREESQEFLKSGLAYYNGEFIEDADRHLMPYFVADKDHLCMDV